VTPLLDERSIGALFDLRGRGFDVAAIDVSAIHATPRRTDPVGRLAHRIWVMERQKLHRDLQRVGIAVGGWQDGGYLGSPMWEVEASRRSARLAYA
jgi:hypothetical protein